MKYLIIVLIALAMVSCDESEIDLTYLEMKTESSLIGEWELTELITKITMHKQDTTYPIYNVKSRIPQKEGISLNLSSSSKGEFNYKHGTARLPFTYSIINDTFAIEKTLDFADKPYYFFYMDTMVIASINDSIMKCINPRDTSMRMTFINLEY